MPEGIAKKLAEQKPKRRRLVSRERDGSERQREFDVARLDRQDQILRQVCHEFSQAEPGGAALRVDEPVRGREGADALGHVRQSAPGRRILDAASLEDGQRGKRLKVVLGPVIEILKERFRAIKGST